MSARDVISYLVFPNNSGAGGALPDVLLDVRSQGHTDIVVHFSSILHRGGTDLGEGVVVTRLLMRLGGQCFS